MGIIKDLTGKVFGRLTVLELSKNKNTKSRCALWTCQCSCENKTILDVQSWNLVSGHTMSCNCLRNTRIGEASKKYNEYDISGDIGVGYTFKNIKFYFDLEDYDKIKEYCWGTRKGRIATTMKGGKTIEIHKFLLGDVPNGFEIDHIDRNPLNNCKSNLRIVIHKKNSYNSSLGINNTSGFIGVGWSKKSCKWRAYIQIDGEHKGLGYYINKQNAIIARLQAELKYFGIEFAPQRHLFEEYNII
jgi:hypothetical protein